MSVINQMLQDLDRRNAVGAAGAEAGSQAVKPVAAPRQDHRWFWPLLALAVLIFLGAVAALVYDVRLRPFAPEPKLKATEKPRPPVAVQTPAPAPAATAAPAPPPKPEPVQAQPQTAKAAETFKLARSIETPIAQPKPRPAKPAAKKSAPAESKVVLDTREGAEAVNELAETRFRRAVVLLDQSRVSEAEEQLAAALQADPSHVPARQAYVALLLEQQKVAGALRLLREAVDANPTQPTFSLGLARVYAEQQDYPAALAVIDKAGPAAQGADFQALRAAVLQRLGRHAEAVSAYQAAVTKSAQPGGTWTGLGISLEALGRNGEAAQAYKRALGAGALPVELREYAETRLQALQ